MYDERIDGAPVVADEGLKVPVAPNTVGRTVIGVYWDGDKVFAPFDWTDYELAKRTASKDEVQPVLRTWEDYGIDSLYKRAVAGEDIVLQYNKDDPDYVSCGVGGLNLGYASLMATSLLHFHDYEGDTVENGYSLAFIDVFDQVVFGLMMSPDGSVSAEVMN